MEQIVLSASMWHILDNQAQPGWVSEKQLLGCLTNLISFYDKAI